MSQVVAALSADVGSCEEALRSAVCVGRFSDRHLFAPRLQFESQLA